MSKEGSVIKLVVVEITSRVKMLKLGKQQKYLGLGLRMIYVKVNLLSCTGVGTYSLVVVEGKRYYRQLSL